MPLALSNKNITARFVQKDSSFGATESFSTKMVTHNNSGSDFVLMSIDSCIETFSLPIPTMIKIDVDGAEIDVLEGATKLLKNPHLISILVEVDEGNALKVEEILTEASFKLVDEERMDEHTINYIFTRE